MKYSTLFVFALLVLFSCKTKETVINIPETEYRDLDTLLVTAPAIDPSELPNGMVEENFELPRYNPSATREHDLIHTKLDLKFDWDNEKVIGKATLTLKPYFYAAQKLSLDAKNFEFNKINLAGKSQPLKYDYDGKKLVIDLGREYKKEEEFKIEIDYIASPTAQGGSDAITSDKGLFFINPKGEDPEKPQQIWTQGETENNSRWFPTIDKPNERTTQETYLTVQDKYKTLCNGVLESSTKNSDGTRTDYWKMDKPHAPYLFAIVIGDYAVVEDSWNGMLVEYYVEPKYKEYARDIFPYTTEMLTLFSEKLGVKYPWQKYSQAVVRDYVSGAMENTTAAIYGEFMQGTKQELIDNLTNEKIVAHELFHHWFGDLVTTESWANLTMNEGFANYSEYIWLEHKYGSDEADFHRMNELNGYLSSARNHIHDLIDFGYEDKENMFDAHSYNKGGLVLHMLRNYVGDDAFYAALNYYLTQNEYTDVEAHELRLAFEEVVGEDLNWFFNQWYFDKGQPVLKVNYDYDETTKKVMVSVEQTQDGRVMPAIFQLPVAIDIYDKNGKATRQEVMINQRKQNFEFDAASKPALVNFDADKVVLGVIDEESKTEENYIFQYKNAPKFLDRFEALDALARNNSANSKPIFKAALKDKFYVLRAMGIASVDLEDTEASNLVAQLAKTDPKSQVRGAALDKLAETSDKRYIEVAKYIIDHDKAYNVVGAALEMLNQLDGDAALEYAKKLENEESGAILNAVGEIYISKNDPKYMSFFENKWDDVDGFAAISFVDNYAKLASNENVETIVNAANKLKDVAINMGQSPWRRFAATKAINDLHGEVYGRANDITDAAAQTDLRTKDNMLIQLIEDIKSTEDNEQLLQFYANFPNPPAKP